VTLILAAGNRDQFIQFSDRRLTYSRGIFTEEADKAISLVCADGRFLVGFCGLARAGNYRTHTWLIETIADCAKVDPRIGPILDALQERVTGTFRTNADILRLPNNDRRMSVLLSGYFYGEDPPLAVCELLTNYDNFLTGEEDLEARSEFSRCFRRETRPSDGPFALVVGIGASNSIKQDDIDVLGSLVKEMKPANAIIGKGVETIRQIADRPSAHALIGKQLSTVCLPRELDQPISCLYHTNTPKPIIFTTAHIDARSAANGIVAFRDGSVHAGPQPDGTLPLIAFPKTGRNAPCPCGSGMKFKRCHGGPKR